ncbi:substrate-binding domain-containing protein [Streptomyces sp. NPDC091289]|uniref:protein kinase domain-containing protein n=1 Tax=Streptomyces sp. NPDC091289 TaxID=3365989 RepID=UPI0037F11808
MTLTGEDPRVIGRYRLLSRLGAGGMGVVYLARSPSERQVAVKVIRPDLAQDPDFRTRFRREVAAARQVSGAFTAAVVDADCDAETPWLATVYIAGSTLAEHVARKGPLAEAEVYRLAMGLVEALHDIHRTGLVHRDLKPGNVLLADDGPRVIDFGIARIADATQLTSTGVVVGTPPFMAPEQFRRGEAGPATDVFSLGAVLAYAGSGHGPFGGDSSHAVGFRVVHEEPDLTGLPASLQPLVLHCLAKDPAARPTVSALLRTLPDVAPAALSVSRPESPHPPTEPSGTVLPAPQDRLRKVEATPSPEPTQTAPPPPVAPPHRPGTPPPPAPTRSATPGSPPRRRVTRRWALAGLAAALVVAAATTVPLLMNGDGKGSGKENPQGKGTGAPSGGGASSSAAAVDCPTSTGTVAGSGVSVHKILMDQWNQEFAAVCPATTMAYQPVGAGAGLADFTDGKAAFAVIDEPRKAEEINELSAHCQGGRAIHIPLGAAPVTVVVNLPGVQKAALGPSALAMIFNGDLTRWNDQAIADTNPGVALPDTAVKPVTLSEESGTTRAFTTFLAAHAPGEWKHPPAGTLPVNGTTAQGTSGVADVVQSTPGAVAVLPGAFAATLPGLRADLATGRDSSSTATPENVTKALSEAEVTGTGGDLSLSLEPESGLSGAYPLLQPLYAVVCEKGGNAPGLRAFLTHALSEDGRATAAELGYGPLPTPLTDRALRTVRSLS